MAAHLGRRLRRGATSGAVVAAAVAALAASQAPGTTPPPTDSASGDLPIGAGDASTPPGGSASGDSPYYTELPTLNTPNKPGAPGNSPIITGPAEAGIPATVLAAYKRAEQSIRSTDPGCNLPWQLLAGIGKVESGQANGGAVDANGTTTTAILGPVLNGRGFANISDTDQGAYDGDRVHDRAIGPMQFIPSTWATWGQDANGDGKKDPSNIYDAAQAAGLYLCANDRNLAVKADLDRAILSYNRSTEYLNTVLSWFEYYKRGSHQVPDGTGVLPGNRSDDRVTTPGGGTPSPTAPVRPTPTTPAKPKPTTPAKPTPKPTPTPTTPPTTDPVARVARIKDASSGSLTATTGNGFAARPAVQALDAAGRPVAGVQVRFRIVGDTDARFAVGAREVTTVTASDGKAVAPALKAGERTGDFTVSATVVGRSLNTVSLGATVTDRTADTLTRLDAKELAATTGGEFADPVKAKATEDGAVAAGVGVTATFVTSATDPTPLTDGPFFKAADGTAVRTLTVRTDADGLLTLPKIYAGDKAGTFVLRLTAPGGGTLTVELTVNAPAPDPAPTQTPTPAPTSSPSPTS
ncbi:lytic transglycosylase domain-containing protein [Streptomyces sp. NPDC053493]|uniref:lytic transglycosylase domain-containing protein n=1 Tax=Streptomyces sp. NPDC053493 TaxID=3365705 RepID=UPI0037CD5D3F